MSFQVWEERDRVFVAGGDLTMDEDCLILLIDADTKVRHTLFLFTSSNKQRLQDTDCCGGD